MTSNLVAFDRLPLGARFKYAGHPRIYVKLGRGDAQCGLIAVWDDAQLDWPGQQIFSLSDTPSERATCMVQWIDQKPVETTTGHCIDCIELKNALAAAIGIANEARECHDRDQDMRTMKLLIALSGHLPKWRADTDRIHDVLRRAVERLSAPISINR